MLLTLLSSQSAPPVAAPVKAWLRVAGTWKETTVHTRIAGLWKTATPFIKVAGTWRNSSAGVAEVSAFTFLSNPEAWPFSGPASVSLYFTIGVPTGQMYVYFGRDGSVDPAPSGFVRGACVDPGDISYGTPATNRTTYAQTMVSVFNSDPDLSATRVGDVVTITSRATGARANIGLGTLLGSDASVAVITQGS
jgi:hypothetical protein